MVLAFLGNKGKSRPDGRLSYATERRAYYHVAQALDVALPNARSGEGKVDARLRHGGVVDDAEQIERAERSKHKPNPAARQSSCSNTSGTFTALQRSSQVSGWLTQGGAIVGDVLSCNWPSSEVERIGAARPLGPTHPIPLASQECQATFESKTRARTARARRRCPSGLAL